jgi:hypothetical protein
MSSLAWPRDKFGGGEAQLVHMAAWNALPGHNFLLRLSASGPGTSKFLQVSNAPLFSADVTLRTPKQLVIDLRQLHKCRMRCARTCARCASVRDCWQRGASSAAG